MDQKISERYDVFAIDLTKMAAAGEDGLFLVFSPVTNDAFYVTHGILEQLKQELSSPSVSDSAFHDFILDVRNSSRSAHGHNLVEIPENTCYLSISPTAQCNFHCSYCYAKEEHGNQRLTSKQMIAVCDRFISSDRGKNGNLVITFLGGGEPLLEAVEVMKTIAFIREKARRLSIHVKTGIISNMSLCNTEICDFLVANGVVITASFELLQDVQDKQREKYAVVSERLKCFLEKGGYASVRATITSLNVERQEEMVTALIRSYPGIKDAAFEPVTDFSSFNSPHDYTSFIKTFLHNYEIAKKRAEEVGIVLSCSYDRRIDVTEQRFCPPEWNLTSTGELTVCHRLTDGNNKFGLVDSDGVVSINESLFKRIVKEDTGKNPECHSCFAKWNCGGGCRAQNLAASRDFKQANCELFRSFLKRQLIFRLNSVLKENGVQDIPSIKFD